MILEGERKAEGGDERGRQRVHEGCEVRQGVALDAQHLHRMGAPSALAIGLGVEHEGGLAVRPGRQETETT